MELSYETLGININNNKANEVATPKNICKDMSDLFDFTDCNNKIWADIYCKSGNTIEALLNKGVDKNNILAICDNPQSQMLICRKLYGGLLEETPVELDDEKYSSFKTFNITRRGQVYYIHNWKDKVNKHYQDAYNVIQFGILKEMEKSMSIGRERESLHQRMDST